MSKAKKEIGEIIRELRKEKGLSSDELGELVGLSGSAIRNIEVGRRKIKIETLVKISKALNIPINDFFYLLDSNDNKIEVNEFRKKLGENIKILRKTKNISQAELANKLGVTQSYIANIEQGKRRISCEFLIQISKSLEVSFIDLLDQNSLIREMSYHKAEKLKNELLEVKKRLNYLQSQIDEILELL